MYDIKAYSQDPVSVQKRTEYMEDIIRDMQAKDFIENIQQTLNINTYRTDPKTLPMDEDELGVHMQMDYKQNIEICLLYTSPSPRDVEESRMPSSA